MIIKWLENLSFGLMELVANQLKMKFCKGYSGKAKRGTRLKVDLVRPKFLNYRFIKFRVLEIVL